MGCWPDGYLLSAAPTQPAQGRPVALPLPPFSAVTVPFPFSEGDPFRVDAYGLVDVVLLLFAPVLLLSAFEYGWAWL